MSLLGNAIQSIHLALDDFSSGDEIDRENFSAGCEDYAKITSPAGLKKARFMKSRIGPVPKIVLKTFQMKVNLLICLLSAAFVALVSNAEGAPKEVPQSIGFEGRTYATRGTTVTDDKYRLLLLDSPNLPDYDDE